MRLLPVVSMPAPQQAALRGLAASLLTMLSLGTEECTDWFLELDAGMDPQSGSEFKACAMVNGTDTLCTAACQANITALLRNCIDDTFMDGNVSRSLDTKFAPQLQADGPADCNYSIPPRPPAPRPSPRPSPAPAPEGPSDNGEAAFPLWIIAAIAVAVLGVVVVGTAFRRCPPAAEVNKEPLLGGDLENVGAE
eukprot:COSAG02_NODE_3534_length_6598_cov_2.728112_6_plen_194_part_00